MSPLDRLTVAVVGSGPAACYAAEELLSTRGLDVQVNMFERLLAPWGLARYGVAPDHLATREVISTFQRTAARPGFRLHLNVEVGTDITHSQLMDQHHAVLYAHGCAASRSLDLPGEQIPGSHPVRDFVGWYNGHPDHVDHSFDLSHERAVVIGNGNVALDVARILTSRRDRLWSTDIAAHALDVLAGSNVREVIVLGRRGLADAAFTTAELIGLQNLRDVDISVEGLSGDDDSGEGQEYGQGLRGAPAINAHKASLLRQLSGRDGTAPRRIVLRFLTSPAAILGDHRVAGLRVVRNELRRDSSGRAVAESTGETDVIDAGLVLQSVGYRGVQLAGLPFDDQKAVVPNDAGRVLSASGGQAFEPGTYVAGWIKRGPSGVMGTNKACARQTVAAVLADHAAGALQAPDVGGSSLADALSGSDVVDSSGWGKIDARELSLGREQGRPRVKLVERAEMLRTARS